MQRRIAAAQRLQSGDRLDYVVAVVAGAAVALADVMQLLLQRQPAGVLRMAAVDRVADRVDPTLWISLEPDAPHRLAIDRRDLLAPPQIGQRGGALGRRDAVRDTAAGAALIDAEH